MQVNLQQVGDYMSDIQNFIRGVKILIDTAINKAPYDATYQGVIKEIEESGLYTVTINNRDYAHTKALGSGALSVNDIVYVTFPQNNINLRFILNI